MTLAHVVLLYGYSHEHVISYYTLEPIHLGDLVSVPYGKSTRNGIVIRTEPLHNNKQLIKQARFQLKKINSVIHSHYISEHLIQLTESYALLYVLPHATILSLVLPKKILEIYDTVHQSSKYHQDKTDNAPSISVIQKPFLMRTHEYKNMIRDSFAQKQDVMIMAPTHDDAMTLYARIASGIESYVIVCSEITLNTKKGLGQFMTSLDTDHPYVYIVTPLYAVLISGLVTQCIIDQESSPYYLHAYYDGFDSKSFLYDYMIMNHKKIILADTLLSPETYLEHSPSTQEKNYLNNHPGYESIVIHTKPKKDDTQIIQKKFEVIPESIIRSIKPGKKVTGKHIIITPRKGYATSIVCNDCGHYQSCPTCDRIFIFSKEHHQSQNETYYTLMCHTCKHHHTLHVCQKCTGWRLAQLGRGQERIIESLYEHIPSDICTVIDHTKSSKKIHADIAHFYTLEDAVIVSTPRILNYLTGPVDSISIISSDSLIMLPRYDAEMMALRTFYDACEYAPNGVHLVTNIPSHPVYHALQTHTAQSYYESLLDERKKFSFPPYVMHIMITIPYEPSCEQHITTLLSGFTVDIHITKQATQSYVKILYTRMLCMRPWLINESLPDRSFFDIIGILKKHYPGMTLSINPTKLI